MVEQVAGRDAEALAGIAELERRVVAAGGGRLTQGWDSLRARRGDR